ILEKYSDISSIFSKEFLLNNIYLIDSNTIFLPCLNTITSLFKILGLVLVTSVLWNLLFFCLYFSSTSFFKASISISISLHILSIYSFCIISLSISDNKFDKSSKNATFSSISFKLYFKCNIEYLYIIASSALSIKFSKLSLPYFLI